MINATLLDTADTAFFYCTSIWYLLPNIDVKYSPNKSLITYKKYFPASAPTLKRDWWSLMVRMTMNPAS